MTDVSQDTKELAAKASRGGEGLDAEDLIANELATAILSDPLNKIRHICEALFLLSEGEKQAAHISKEDEEDAEKIYKLTTVLQNVHIDTIEDENGRTIERGAVLAWPFVEDDADEWLDFAERVTWKYYEDEEHDDIRKVYDDGEELRALFLATEKRITVDSYKRLKIQFVNYYMERANKLLRKVMNQVSESAFEAAVNRLSE